VTVRPADITFDVTPGEAVMAAASRHGYFWPTTCGGRGECSLCAMVVEDGADELGPPSAAEAETLRRAVGLGRFGTVRRLACQVCPSGDLVVWKRGVRPRADLPTGFGGVPEAEGHRA
jgi:ferredoxin